MPAPTSDQRDADGDGRPAARRPAAASAAGEPQRPAYAISWPTSATRNETPATPMSGKKPASGVSTAAYASRVQPKPPNGIREYANSTSTQQQAAASGQQPQPADQAEGQPEHAEEQRLEQRSAARRPRPRGRGSS